jgi:hypothetical protein
MKFPEYVPPAVRKFFIVTRYKLSEAIEECEERFTEYKNLKNRLSKLCEVWELEPCSSKNVQLQLNIFQTEHRKLRSRLDLIQRLAGNDDRMKDAYNALRKEMLTEGQWIRYFASAYTSARDYPEYRSKAARAADLLDKFVAQCGALIKTCEKLQQTGVLLPIEMYNAKVEMTYPQLYHIWTWEPPGISESAKHPRLVKLLSKSPSGIFLSRENRL